MASHKRTLKLRSTRIVSTLPSFDSNPTFRKTIRFVMADSENKGEAGVIVNTSSLKNLQFISIAATSPGNALRLYDAVRLRKVCVYGPPSNTNDFADISVEWNGYNNPNTSLIASGTESGPASIEMAPPLASNAHYWISTTDGSNLGLFSVFGPANTRIDVTIDFQLLDIDSADPAHAITQPVGSAVGYITYNFLDNTNSSGGAGFAIASVIKDLSYQTGLAYGS